MKETCVLCGVETPYTIDEHIDTRYGYVEGCGQLCRECYDKPNSEEEDSVKQ